MKFFLTGITGFIGIHLSKKLLDQGHQIVALVRSRGKLNLLSNQNIEIIEGDLSLFKDKFLVLPQCDVFIHLAAVVSPLREKEYYTYNYEAVKDIINCLQRQSWKPKRFIFASSLAAAGPTTSNIPLTEAFDTEPVEHYGRAKKMAEEYLSTIKDFPISVFRAPIVLGPQDTGLLRVSMKMARRGIGVKVRGTNQVFSYIYIDDLTDAILKMSLQEDASYEVYFVSANSTASQKELWDTICQHMNSKIYLVPIPRSILYVAVVLSTVIGRMRKAGKNPVNFRFYKQATAANFICSSKKLQERLGWQPKYDLPTAIGISKKLYVEMGLL